VPRSRTTKAILLPGIDGSGRLYGPLLAARPRLLDPEVVAYPPDQPLGYDDLHPRVRAALPRRGRFVLVAESFSGPLAVRVAADPPRGLVAVVLAASFLHRPLHPLLHPIRGLFGARFFGLAPPAHGVRHFLAGHDAPDPLVALVQEVAAAVTPETMAARALAALRVDVRDLFARTRVPVLYLQPTRDRLIRTDVAHEVLALRPDAEATLLDAPHMILQRAPHACLARIEEFLARPGSRAGTAAPAY
jgi:pimeloyl-ACP methyl ester carboxylesterase